MLGKWHGYLVRKTNEIGDKTNKQTNCIEAKTQENQSSILEGCRGFTLVFVDAFV